MNDNIGISKGFYCTLEGGEGCGKTTILKKLKYLCEEKSFLTFLNTITERLSGAQNQENTNRISGSLFVREPGSTPLAQSLREIAVNMKLSVWGEVAIFGLARASLLRDEIYPALDENMLVISDRGIDSSLVYQGIGRGNGVVETLNYNKALMKGYYYRFPDLTIILDLEPEIGLERIKINNRETNKFEKEDIEYHKMIKAGFNILAEGYYPSLNNSRFEVIDASADEKTVFKNVVRILVREVISLLNGNYLEDEGIEKMFREEFFTEFDEYVDIPLSAAELDNWFKERNL